MLQINQPITHQKRHSKLMKPIIGNLLPFQSRLKFYDKKRA